jgi:hypothetical protein
MVRYLSRVSRDRIGTFCDCVISRRLSKWNLLEARSTVVGPPTRSLPSWRPSQHPDHKERLLTGRFGTEWAVLYFTTTRPSVPCHTRHPFTYHTREIRSCPLPLSPEKQRIFLLIPLPCTTWKPHQRLPTRSCFSFPLPTCASLSPKTTPATQPTCRHYRCDSPSLIISLVPSLLLLSEPAFVSTKLTIPSTTEIASKHLCPILCNSD